MDFRIYIKSLITLFCIIIYISKTLILATLEMVKNREDLDSQLSHYYVYILKALVIEKIEKIKERILILNSYPKGTY
jgi:hypothetical protein